MLTSTGMSTMVMMVVHSHKYEANMLRQKVTAFRKHSTKTQMYCISPSMSIWMVVSIRAVLMAITCIVEKGLAWESKCCSLLFEKK